jgi:hypothetical protein
VQDGKIVAQPYTGEITPKDCKRDFNLFGAH